MLRWLGSIKVAVPLLLAIAAVLAWGTFYEAQFGTAAVQRFIYQSVWFQLLLGFLGVNLAIAAFDRYPWKRRHIPFVLAHLGIILVLTGAVLGVRWGVEGRLIIPEGEESGTLRLSQKILLVHQPNPGLHEVIPVHFESIARNHQPHQAFRFAGAEGSVNLEVDRYYPDAVSEERVHADGPAKNPAVHLRLEWNGQARNVWLFSRDPGRFGAQWGRFHLLFLEVRNPGEFRKLPAQRLPPDTILLVRTQSDGRLFGLFTGGKNQARRIGPIETGKGYPHPFQPIRLTVTELVTNGRLEKSFTLRGEEVRGEALHVIARQGEETRESWLVPHEPVTLALGRHPTVVEYREAAADLPFSLKLLDFRKTDYPGTDIASGFESDVELTDPQRAVTLRRTIRMNHPLKYRGFSLFQSSYIAGPPETTILSVRKDPGTPLVYAGCLIIVAGIVALFIFRGRP